MGEAAGHRFGQIIGEEIFEKAIYTLLKGFAEKHQLYLDKEETRRAALLEAAEIAKECAKERRKEEEKYGEHVKNDPRSIWASCRASEAEVIVAKIDRLAQEG